MKYTADLETGTFCFSLSNEDDDPENAVRTISGLAIISSLPIIMYMIKTCKTAPHMQLAMSLILSAIEENVTGFLEKGSPPELHGDLLEAAIHEFEAECFHSFLRRCDLTEKQIVEKHSAAKLKELKTDAGLTCHIDGDTICIQLDLSPPLIIDYIPIHTPDSVIDSRAASAVVAARVLLERLFGQQNPLKNLRIDEFARQVVDSAKKAR